MYLFLLLKCFTLSFESNTYKSLFSKYSKKIRHESTDTHGMLHFQILFYWLNSHALVVSLLSYSIENWLELSYYILNEAVLCVHLVHTKSFIWKQTSSMYWMQLQNVLTTAPFTDFIHEQLLLVQMKSSHCHVKSTLSTRFQFCKPNYST